MHAHVLSSRCNRFKYFNFFFFIITRKSEHSEDTPCCSQVRGGGPPADQPDMVPDGDDAVGDRARLRSVPGHLHTQLPVVQPAVARRDAGRERQPPVVRPGDGGGRGGRQPDVRPVGLLRPRAVDFAASSVAAAAVVAVVVVVRGVRGRAAAQRHAVLRERQRPGRVHVPGRHQLLGVQRGDQDHPVRGADGAQPAADLRAAGGQAAAGQADRGRAQVGGQGAADGPDHADAAGRAHVVPDHRVPAGHPGAAHAAAGQTVLPGLLPEHGRGDGHAGAGQLRHQLHTVLRDEPPVPQHVQPAVPARVDAVRGGRAPRRPVPR